MAQAVIIDIGIAALLMLFIVVGARKGLLRSVAGLVILVVSVLGAALVSSLVTPLISDAVRPVLMETVESKLAEFVEEIKIEDADQGGLDLSGIDLSQIDLSKIDLSGIQIGGLDLGSIDLSKIDLSQIDLDALLQGHGQPDASTPVSRSLPEAKDVISSAVSSALDSIRPAEQIDLLLDQLGIDPVLAAGLADAALEKITESGISVVEALVQVVLETVVHAIVFLVAFVALNILLRIILTAMDLVLMLPGLRTLNSLGGAVVALVECVLLLFLLVWVARRSAVDVATLSQGTILFRFFVNNTPWSVLSLL